MLCWPLWNGGADIDQASSERGAAGGFMPYPLKTRVLTSSPHTAVVFGDRGFGKVIRSRGRSSHYRISVLTGFPCSSAGKEAAWNAGDLGSIPGPGRSLGEGNGNSLQYSCLENPRGQSSLAGYIHGVAGVGHDLATKPAPPPHWKKETKLEPALPVVWSCNKAAHHSREECLIRPQACQCLDAGLPRLQICEK